MGKAPALANVMKCSAAYASAASTSMSRRSDVYSVPRKFELKRTMFFTSKGRIALMMLLVEVVEWMSTLSETFPR